MGQQRQGGGKAGKKKSKDDGSCFTYDSSGSRSKKKKDRRRGPNQSQKRNMRHEAKKRAERPKQGEALSGCQTKCGSCISCKIEKNKQEVLDRVYGSNRYPDWLR